MSSTRPEFQTGSQGQIPLNPPFAKGGDKDYQPFAKGGDKAEDTAAVRAQGLTRSFGKTEAVKGVDLAIERGEIFGFLGPDGAGKSTTLRLLGGLLTPDRGSAFVLGYDIIKQKERVTSRIAFVSEGFPLYGTLSVRENIEFHAKLRLVPDKEARERKKELLAFSRLENYEDRLAENLSGGMKKKLALCCALIHRPDVVFLDEPTTGIDPLSRRELWSILLRYRSQGITICLSTPYMDEAEKCDRLALFYSGRIIGLGRPEDLKKQLPGENLELTVGSPWKAMELLSNGPGIMQAQVLGNSVRLTLDDIESRLPGIQKRLTDNNISLTGWERTAFTVEDAFITLIGPASDQPRQRGFLPPPFPLPGRAAAGPGQAVEVSDLTRKFDSFTAVDRVSFAIRQGEIFGFLGPNGAGNPPPSACSAAFWRQLRGKGESWAMTSAPRPSCSNPGLAICPNASPCTRT